MRTNHLVAVLVGLAAIAMVAADASAYYHPGMGTFMSRDPGAGASGPARIGAAGPAMGGGFAQRDPMPARPTRIGTALYRDGVRQPEAPFATPARTDAVMPPRIGQNGWRNQYADGMNLYQYVGANPLNYVDPQGLRRSGGGAASGPSSACDACGPDVTEKVKFAVTRVAVKFSYLTEERKDSACDAFTSGAPDPQKGNSPMWLNAWDIEPLHNQGWINSPPYTPSCATTPNCKSTVEVDGKCFYAGSVNYVIFGHMWRLCKNREGTGKTLIWGYKGPIPFLRKAAANYEPSVSWYSAGYNGWPVFSKTPDADRPKCSTTCKVPCTKTFKVYWGTLGHL